MGVATNVRARAVVHRLGLFEHAAKRHCSRALVGHYKGCAMKLCLNDRSQVLGIYGWDMERAHRSTAFNQREHSLFADAAGAQVLALAGVFVLLLPADIGFVN